MPTVQVQERGTFEAEEGKKLVLVLEDNGVDILHRCGGNAKCTTCSVEVLAGDAGEMGEAEAAVRQAKGITDPNVRLSCQIRVHGDLEVNVLKTAASTGLEPGTRPQD
ncbi:2Fe-2S iron-sulfur cluster-binding protein [Paenibacillus sp. CF384]|uniref:2Fe-2S iron-sulfur cluster-binding protein n=1 Tax=Paenibacillus sp. CF384 TaxID=1884382 RepID=UPI000899D53A|nr:2Fe-2S iron-sulfur cluster-binding protein [Paenibacillus sp. CF384]SDX86981.1 Ferredoxin [Paenibacillus sp. CF384]